MPDLADLRIVVISLDEPVWLLVDIHILQQLVDLPVLLACLGKDRPPEELVVDVELDSQVYYLLHVVAAVFHQDIDGLVHFASLDVQVRLLLVQLGLLAELSRLEGWVVLSSLEEVHELRAVKLDVERDLHLVVLLRHLLVLEEDLVEKEVDIVV